jgi:hypothetical protein
MASARDTAAHHTGTASEVRLLLISPVGFAYGWVPMNIARLRAFVASSGAGKARTLSLCVRFSAYVARERPELAEHDRQMGEWGSSFHELYFGARYFGHENPETLIREAVNNQLCGRDIFKAAPWQKRLPASTAMVDYQSRSLLEFCHLIESFSVNELERELAAFPADVIGFSVSAQQVTTSAWLAREARRLAPGATIVFGGPAILPRTAADYRRLVPEVDLFVHGDGEDALCALLEAVNGRDATTVPSVQRRRGGAVPPVVSAVRPPAARIPALDYEEDGEPFSGLPLTTWFGRGCSWGRCVFCAIPEEQRHTDNRPAKALEAELASLARRFGTVRFRFSDWEVNGSRNALSAFCRAVIATGRRFEFWAEINARHLDEELMALMQAAGFVSLQVGLEAFSDPLLRKMRKPASLVDNVQCMKLAHRFGIELFSNLIYNVPGESEGDALENLSNLKLLRHLMRGPVSLALIEFMMEIDADAYRTTARGIGGAYAFESRCFPDGASAPHFLCTWEQPCASYWAGVQRELNACAGGGFHLTHRRDGEAVIMRDSREDPTNPRIHRLNGLAAQVYLAVTDEIRSLDQVRAACGVEDPGTLDQAIGELAAGRLIVQSGRRLLGLGLAEAGRLERRHYRGAGGGIGH